MGPSRLQQIGATQDFEPSHLCRVREFSRSTVVDRGGDNKLTETRPEVPSRRNSYPTKWYDKGETNLQLEITTK